MNHEHEKKEEEHEVEDEYEHGLALDEKSQDQLITINGHSLSSGGHNRLLKVTITFKR